MSKKEHPEDVIKETELENNGNLTKEEKVTADQNSNGNNEKRSEPEINFQKGVEDDKGKQNLKEEKVTGKVTNSSKGKRKGIPNDFCIAHPRSVKKTTDFFQDVHSKKLAELLEVGFREAFHMFDFDRDGIINHEDLKKTFASLNINNVNDEEIDEMLLEALNPLNFDAFVILLGYKTLDLDPEEVFLDALSNWDDHHDGLISHEGLLHDIMALGDKFTEEEANSALADAPVVFTKTKEKMIDYVQFSEDLCGLRKMMQRKQPTN